MQGAWNPCTPQGYKGPSCRRLAPPALPFMRIKGSKTRRGDPDPPLRHKGNARKIFSRCACTPEAHPHLERKIFPLARMPSRSCKRSIFLGSPPRSQEGTANWRWPYGLALCCEDCLFPLKCAFREHNAVGQGFLSHKNPCAPPQAHPKMES